MQRPYVLAPSLRERSIEVYGEGGIRTHGRSPFNKFRVCRIRPLCHLSLIQLSVISNLKLRLKV